MPSGNSVASANLFYLSEALQNPDYREKSQKTVLSASNILENYGFLIPRMLIAATTLGNQSDTPTKKAASDE